MASRLSGMTVRHWMASRRGVTLIEMLVVLTIIGLVATLTTLSVNHAVARARQSQARAQMEVLSGAAQSFRMDQGRLPSTLAELESPSGALRTPFPPGGYLQANGVPLDPWGNDYVYVIGGEMGFSISSLGEDRQPGGDGFAADMSTADRVGRS